MATQNVPHSNPRSRASKINKNKSETALGRGVEGKNILFLNDTAEIHPSRPYYNPIDPAGDIANGLACIAYLLGSHSNAGNEEVPVAVRK